MAQATEQNTTFFPSIEPACRAFCMETELSNLTAMSRLAEVTVQAVVGETKFADGEVAGHLLTMDSVERVMFAVVHLAEMVEAFENKYWRALRQAPTEQTEH